ncbi:MAG: nucleotidyltransferase domain-containing protein [Alphaproteobacteria bacterium]
MRITEYQLKSIKEVFVQYFLPEDKIWLFGSRADPRKKGGDIDLYIETNLENLTKTIQLKIKFLVELKQRIGDQKIDVIIKNIQSKTHLPIYDEAKATGIELI